MNKTQLLTALQTRNSHLSKNDISGVIDSLSSVVIEGLKTEGNILIPGIVKLKAVTKAATTERQGIDPFTKQPKTFPAKPESKKIKAAPVKALKEALDA